VAPVAELIRIQSSWYTAIRAPDCPSSCVQKQSLGGTDTGAALHYDTRSYAFDGFFSFGFEATSYVRVSLTSVPLVTLPNPLHSSYYNTFNESSQCHKLHLKNLHPG
jgi:hypothetical protein